MRSILSAVVFFGFSMGVSLADEAAFKPLLIEPAKTLNDRCRNGIVTHRIEKWHKKDHLGVPQPSSFDSVEKIMSDMAPEAIERLEDQGCDPRYLWGFIGCTALDDPNFKSDKIVARGVTADTDEEMAVIMKRCIDGIAEAGVAPAL